jgi:hypothetical protein
MYHEGMQVDLNIGAVRLLLEEVAFSYIFNFLRTAETISLNQQVLLNFKITFIKSL